MKTKVSILVTLLGFISLSSCDEAEKIFNLTSCKYELDGVTNPKVAGVSFSNISSVSDVSVLDVIKLTAAYSSKSLPLSANINVKVVNPNSSEARLHKFDWAIDLEQKEIVRGTSSRLISIPSNGSELVPLEVNVDLMDVVQNGSLNDLLQLALSFAGMGEESSDLSVRIRPTVTIAGQDFTSPKFITVKKTVSPS